MDQDDDNDEQQEDEQNEDEDKTVKTYSKKNLFGKTTKDITFATLKTQIKTKPKVLKDTKITIENYINKYGYAPSSAIKIKNKTSVGEIKSDSKVSINFKSGAKFDKWTFNNTLKTKIIGSQLSLSWKTSNKLDLNCKLSNAFKFAEYWKVKNVIEADKKADLVTPGYSFNLERKKFYKEPTWLPFVSQYTKILGLGFNWKKNSRKIQTSYKGHLCTSENHKFYWEHKLSMDTSDWKCNNTITANFQDSLGIGTLNGQLGFEGRVLKNKEFRFVIEFQKSLAFGVQRRNQTFELMMRKTRTGYRWLRRLQMSVGNKGFVASCDGKVNLWRWPIDYTLCYKLRQIQNNFYEDSTLGFSLRHNL